MPNILSRLELAANTNPAEALKLLSELFRAVHEGIIVELPCKVGERISSSESIEEIVIDKNGIDVNISESYSCSSGFGIRHRREKYMDKTINLCDTCQKCFADCDNGKEGKNFFFGVELENDNVYKCGEYKPREAAIKMLESES